MIRLFGIILSARAILLLSIIGAFALGVFAMAEPNTVRLWVLIAYAMLTVLPCTYLEMKGKR